MAFLSARPLATLASQSNEEVQQIEEEGIEREEAVTESEEEGTERDEEGTEREEGDAPTLDVMYNAQAGTIENVREVMHDVGQGTVEEVTMRKHLLAICDDSYLVYSSNDVAKVAASLVHSLKSQLPPDRRKGALRSGVIFSFVLSPETINSVLTKVVAFASKFCTH
jgi:hypothetical protein